MRISAFARPALVMWAAFGMAACSGGSQAGSVPALPNSPQQQSASATIFDAGNSKGWTYVAPIGTTTVYGYNRRNRSNQPPVCTVGPFVSVNGGIGVDQSGNLWVPDEGANPKTITEYGPDCGPAKTVLSDPGDAGPDNVAFDTNGHVYVSNSFANSGGPGNILQYTGTSITKTLSDPDIATPQGLAVDKRNNVWVSYRDPGSTGTYVAEFPRGKMPAKLFKNISLGFPGSLQFDRNQNLMGPNGNFSSLDIYAPPYTQSKPTTRLILENGQVTDPSMCTFGPDQDKLYCTFGFFSLVNVFSYPGGKFLYTYNNGLSGLLPFGIANDPAPRT
jgi:sugar lactone lactonase YvrE